MTDAQKKMKRYCTSIERRLNLPLDVKTRVMNDFTTTIAAMREAGRSDEEIYAELGDPQKVAQELNQQMQEYALKKSPWRFVCLIAAGIAFLWMMLDCFMDTIISGFLTEANNSLGIIGGADGPTAIFVTTAPGSTDWDFVLAGLIFSAGIAGYFWLRRGRAK